MAKSLMTIKKQKIKPINLSKNDVQRKQYVNLVVFYASKLLTCRWTLTCVCVCVPTVLSRKKKRRLFSILAYVVIFSIFSLFAMFICTNYPKCFRAWHHCSLSLSLFFSQLHSSVHPPIQSESEATHRNMSVTYWWSKSVSRGLFFSVCVCVHGTCIDFVSPCTQCCCCGHSFSCAASLLTITTNLNSSSFSFSYVITKILLSLSLSLSCILCMWVYIRDIEIVWLSIFRCQLKKTSRWGWLPLSKKETQHTHVHTPCICIECVTVCVCVSWNVCLHFLWSLQWCMKMDQ